MMVGEDEENEEIVEGKLSALLKYFQKKRDRESRKIPPVEVPPPKSHANVCLDNPPKHSDYAHEELLFGPQDDYEFVIKVGRGRYSEVFRAIDLIDNKDVVVKMLKPVRRLKVRREIKILQTMQSTPFVIKLHDIVVDPSTRTPALVFEYVDCSHFRKLWPQLTIEDI